MKTLILTILIIGSINMLHAQKLHSKLFVAGSLGFDYTSSSTVLNSSNYNNPNANRNCNVNTSSGYYFTDNFALGLQLCYSITSTHFLVSYIYQNMGDSLYGYKNTSKIFCIAPLLRYTIPVSDKFYFNLNITVPYSYTKYKDGSNSSLSASYTTGYIFSPSSNTSISYGLNIYPELQWFVKENLAITGSLGALSYNHIKTISSENKYKLVATAQSNNLKLSLYTGISIGVLFYFGGNN